MILLKQRMYSPVAAAATFYRPDKISKIGAGIGKNLPASAKTIGPKISKPLDVSKKAASPLPNNLLKAKSVQKIPQNYVNETRNVAKMSNRTFKSTNGGANVKIQDQKSFENLPKRVRNSMKAEGGVVSTGNFINAAKQFSEEAYSENERLFSTGNDELDAILEEVYFSGIEDGYDYAQKEFGLSAKGIKNKIKAIPRHIKRDVNLAKAGVKISTMEKVLSPEEVRAVAVSSRGAKVPGSKTAKRLSKRVKSGKISEAQADQLKNEAEIWSDIHKNGKGAVRNVFGYSTPERTRELKKLGLA